MTGPAVHAPIGTPISAVLDEMLAAAGGHTLRLVDGRSARVLGTAGWAGRDDIAGLVRLAGAALPPAAADGGLADLVLSTGRAVHVLRPGPHHSVLVLRLGVADDLETARRGLASPHLLGALHAAFPGRPAGMASIPRMPEQRRADVTDTGPMRALRVVPGQRGAHPVREGQPALAVLDQPVAGPLGTGHLAALALTDVAPAELPVRIPMPRRAAPEQPPLVTMFEAAWSQDLDTMRRLLDGLRRLA